MIDVLFYAFICVYFIWSSPEKSFKKRMLQSVCLFAASLGTAVIISRFVPFKMALACNYNLLLMLMFFLLHLKKNRVSIFSYILFGFYLVFNLYATINYFEKAVWINYILSTVVFLLSHNNQLFMKKSYEESVAEYQFKTVQKHVEEVQSIYMTMRGWRHDYHNHMQTLKAHLAMKHYDLADEYLNELENDLDRIDFIVKSGNVNLDAILNSKLSLAQEKQIDINCKVSVPEKLKITDIDLCVLLGNLCDNAVESCETMEESEEKFIRLYIGIFKKQLYISVTNSTKELVRKFDHEYITNKRGNHGHGLKRIDNIVNKYEGFINRKNEPGVFVTEIMLPL